MKPLLVSKSLPVAVRDSKTSRKASPRSNLVPSVSLFQLPCRKQKRETLGTRLLIRELKVTTTTAATRSSKTCIFDVHNTFRTNGLQRAH